MKRTIFAGLVAVLGCSEPEPPATVAGEGHPTKSDWLRVAQRSLQRDHCSADTPFRSCSATTREECETTIAAALRPCVQTMRERLPARITAGEEDERLRLELTGCVWHHAAFALGPTRIDLHCLLTPR
jgi:hypothetical protein